MKFESFIVDLFLPPHAPQVNQLSTDVRMLGNSGKLLDVSGCAITSLVALPSPEL